MIVVRDHGGGPTAHTKEPAVNTTKQLRPSQRLRLFAGAILSAHRGGIPYMVGDVDGGTIQDLAEAFGLIETRPVPKGGCGDRCECADGDSCYFVTPVGGAAQFDAERYIKERSEKPA